MIAWAIILFIPTVVLFFLVYGFLVLIKSWCLGFFWGIRTGILQMHVARLGTQIHELNKADFREGAPSSVAQERWARFREYDWGAALRNTRKWTWSLKDILGDRANIEGVKV